MKAILKNGDVNFTEVNTPTTTIERSVLIQVNYAAVCKTDSGIAVGKIDSSSNIVLGHELCGRIVSINGNKTSWYKAGELVSVNPILAKNCVINCSRETRESMIGKDTNGCFAEYVTVPESAVIRLTPELDNEVGAIIEPIAAALGVINKIRESEKNTSILFSGNRTAAMFGDNRFSRLIKLISDKGFNERSAEDTERPLNSNVQILGNVEDYPDNSFDFVVETDSTKLNEYIRVLKPNGTLILKTRTFDNSSFCINDVVMKELKLVGAKYGDFCQAVEIASRLVHELKDTIEVLPFDEKAVDKLKEAWTISPTSKKLVFKVH